MWLWLAALGLLFLSWMNAAASFCGIASKPRDDLGDSATTGRTAAGVSGRPVAAREREGGGSKQLGKIRKRRITCLA